MNRIKNENREFLPVKLIEDFLGIPKGTKLGFDTASGKYVSTSVDEEIGEGSFYYSGFAIAIDPVIIAAYTDCDNSMFEVIKPKAKKKPLKIVEETPVEIPDSVPLWAKTHEVTAPTPEPTISETSELWFRCGLCKSVNHIMTVKSGLFFPANPETRLILNCPICSIETIVFYTGSEYEPDKKS